MLAALGGGVAAAVLWIHLESRPYYAAVRISAPGAVTYTALLDKESDRDSCEAAARRFYGPLESDCKDCSVEFLGCERSPREAAGAAYWVIARRVRIAVSGPEESARASCAITAHKLTEGGRAARCEELPARKPVAR